MANKSRELARRWIEKAGNDLITARQTLLLPEGPTDTVCFHAQQAVEKTLKAYLTFHEISFSPIHNLVRLLDLAIAAFPALDGYRKDLAQLSEYAVRVRYPDDSIEPERDEAYRALSLAEKIVERVKRELPQNT